MPSRFFQDVGAFLRSVGKKADQASADNERMNQDISKALGASSFPFTVTTGSDGKATVDYSALKLTQPPGGIAITPEIDDAGLPVFYETVGAPTSTRCVIRARRLVSLLSILTLSAYGPVAGVKFKVIIRPSNPA